MTLYSEEANYHMLESLLHGSTQHLRHVFISRWKIETQEEWIGDTVHVQKLIYGLARRAFERATTIQKTALTSREINEWDMPLLYLVLRNFGSRKRYREENAAISGLISLRSHLVHHVTQKIDKQEYIDNVLSLSSCLKSLGMKEEEIEKLTKGVEEAMSLEAFQTAEKLFAQAKIFQEKGNFDVALQSYSDAIELPNLLPKELGMAYEKRAEFLLKLIEDPSVDDNNKFLDQAIKDATKAVELNESSWSAHYLMAECDKLKENMEGAIDHNKRAIAIFEKQRNLKCDLKFSKMPPTALDVKPDHLSPGEMAAFAEERIIKLEKIIGSRNGGDEEQIPRKMENTDRPSIADHEHEMHAQLRVNYNLPKHMSKVVKRFRKEAKLKNLSSMYGLGLCYLDGNGVKKDTKEAFRLFMEVAKMEEAWPGLSVPYRGNLAIASAQHILGRMYFDGTGVEMNYEQAAYWYQKGMENGSGYAASNLGILYACGHGVERDDKLVEMCWREGVNLKTLPAYEWLAKHYITQLEPEKAMRFFKVGRKMSKSLLKGSEDTYNQLVNTGRVARKEAETDVEKIEMARKLSSKGMTFRERLDRQLRLVDPRLLQFTKSHFRYPDYAEKTSHSAGAPNQLTSEMFEVIKMRAKRGSKTATQIASAVECTEKLNNLLDNEAELEEYEKFQMLHLLYNLLDAGYHLLPLLEIPFAEVKPILEGMLESGRYQNEGPIDMRLRLCYVAFNLQQDFVPPQETRYAEELLSEGLEKYPDSLNYYILLSLIYISKKAWDMATFYVQRGLQKDLNNCELLFLQALLFDITFSELHCEECVEKYNLFLSVAPTDHRKVPDALYRTAGLYFRKIERAHKLNEDDDEAFLDATTSLMTEYFKCGQLAEKQQLPCYLPYDKSAATFEIEMVINSMECYADVVNHPEIKWEQDMGLLERKIYLKSPTRQLLIRFHRRDMKQNALCGKDCDNMMPLKIRQTTGKKMSALIPITMEEMYFTEDHIFENCVIELTVIDEPAPGLRLLSSVVEDRNGDVMRLHVYNVADVETMLKRFAVGCRIAVINPVIKYGDEAEHSSLGIYDTKCIIYLESVKKMCGFCGEENARYSCSNCKMLYCGEECLTLDWDRHDHELICSVKCNSVVKNLK